MNLFEKSLSDAGLGVEALSTEFQIGVTTVLVDKARDPDRNSVVMGEIVIGADIVVFDFCVVEMNKGLFNCIKLETVVNGSLVSAAFSS